MGQLKSALRLGLVDNQLHLSWTEVFETSPFPLPSLFDGILNHIYIKSKNTIGDDASLMISGKIGDVEKQMSCMIDRIPCDIRVDKLFGYFNIRDLEEKIATAPDAEVAALKSRTIQVSMQSGLVSQFTAFSAFGQGTLLQTLQSSRMQSGRQQAMAAPVGSNQTLQNKRQSRGYTQWLSRESQCPQARTPMQEWGSSSRMSRGVACSLFGGKIGAPHQSARPKQAADAYRSRIEEIVMSQHYDGYWERFSGSRKVIIKWNEIGELSEKMRMTVLAIATMKKEGAGQEVIWELVAEKGKKWLSDQDSTIDWDEVNQKVLSLL
jgi:hypothetical protein